MEKELQKRNVLSIFIGSPGDLQEERKIAHSVVNRINKSIGRNLRIHIDLRGWEDTLPGYASRPQEIINRELKDCDIFVGLLWQRWGTPPGGDDGYTSGFEEEYHLALKQKENDQLLEIFLFFKKMSESLSQDPGEQATKVINFKKSVEKDRKVFFDSFNETAEWKDLFYDVIANYITKNFNINVSSSTEGEQTKTNFKDETDKNLIDTSDSLEIIKEGLLSENYYLPDDLQIAKATLYVTSLLYQHVLTDQLLNSKVIHFLYSNREKIVLKLPELQLVLRTLLEDENDSKAGWFWINPKIKIDKVMIYFAENDLINQVRLQALRFLQIESIEDFKSISYKIMEESNSDIASQVAKLFTELADNEDVEFLKGIAENKDDELAKYAWTGVIKGLINENPNAAIKWIIESPLHKRGNFGNHVEELVKNADLSHAKELLTIDENSVRIITLNNLRDKLTLEELKDLSEDENLGISSIAYMELIKRGHNVSEDQLDTQFKKRNEKGSYNLYSILGNSLNYPLSRYDYDNLLFELYKTKDVNELESNVTWDSVKSPVRYAAIIDQNYEKFEEVLKNNIKSGFKHIRNNTIEAYRNKYGELGNSLIEKIDENDSFIKGRFYKYAFQVLSKNARKNDLDIIRDFLKNPHFSYYKDDILLFFLNIIEEFGTDDETDILLDILEKSDYGVKKRAVSIFLKITSKEKEQYAKELLKEDNLELQKLLLNYSLTEEILAKKSVIDLTYRSNHALRLAALAYLAQKLSVQELEEFLQQYPLADGFDFYYYDVICWLDRILYSPKSLKNFYSNSLNRTLE